MAYKPLYIFMSPASIPQIVAHIQDYLVKNPIVSTETIAEIVVQALSEHPELINGSVIPITEDSQQTIKEYIDNLPSIDAYTKAQVDALLDAKQDTLTFDQTPTADSTNPVTSGGVASALAALNTALTTLINSKADLTDVYTKTTIDLLLSEKADVDNVYSKNTIDAKLLQYPTTDNVYTKADIDLMKQVNKDNIAIASSDGTAPVEILAGQYVYLADVLYMATETIKVGSQLIPEGNITINPRGVTNRIGDGLKNAVNQINGLDDRLDQVEQDISSQSQQIGNLESGLGIIVDGDIATQTILADAYAYIKNNTHGLTDGLYIALSAYPASGGTATANNFASIDSGGLNYLSSLLKTRVTGSITKYITSGTMNRNSLYKVGNIVFCSGSIINISNNPATGYFFIIPEGFRSVDTVSVSGTLMINNILTPLLADIRSDGLVSLNYSDSVNATQAYFSGSWFTNN